MRLNPFAGNYLSDPASTWSELLDGPAVRYAEDLGVWLITRYEHVQRALGDAAVFRNAQTLTPVYECCPEALAILRQLDVPPTTATADGPAHHRTRRALRATFASTTLRTQEQYGGIVARRVNELVGRLVGALTGGGEHKAVDLVAEFTAELPLLVLVDILGVPEHDVDRIRQWADGQATLVWSDPGPLEQVRLARGLVDFWRYCEELVGRRIATGQFGDDLVGQLLRYRAGNSSTSPGESSSAGEDEVLTEPEAASLVFNLLIAGHETTAALLTHCLDIALTGPGRWARLVTDPARVPAFVDEVLRFSPAVDGWLRVTATEVELGDVTLPAGARCLLVLGSANRDPAVFDRPDEFDPGRRNLRDQLSFGYGPHYCVGAALARLEAETALIRLAADLPGLRIATDYIRSYRPGIALRTHHELPATLTRTPASLSL